MSWIEPSLAAEYGDDDAFDYEMHHYGEESEILAFLSPVNPHAERIIATFSTPQAAQQAWSLMMEALSFHDWQGRESTKPLFGPFYVERGNHHRPR